MHCLCVDVCGVHILRKRNNTTTSPSIWMRLALVQPHKLDVGQRMLAAQGGRYKEMHCLAQG